MGKWLWSILVALMLVGCGPSDAERIAQAESVVKERPDSAVILLRDVDVRHLTADSLRALYAVVNAWAKAGVGQSLITDSLLPDAVDYYRSVGDSLQWTLATRLAAAHLWTTDRHTEAYAMLDTVLAHDSNAGHQWEMHQQKLEFAALDRDIDLAKRETEWLVAHTDNPVLKLDLTSDRVDLLFLSGERERAAAIADSMYTNFIRDSLKTERDINVWVSFRFQYADILAETGRPRKGIDIMQDIMERHLNKTARDSIYYYTSLAKFHINAGDYPEADRYMALCDSIKGTGATVEHYIESYNALIAAILDFHNTGQVSNVTTSFLASRMDRDYDLRRRGENTAIGAVNDLSRSNYELALQRQRLWLGICAVIICALVVTMLLYVSLRRRRQRLADAEERVETLTTMLNAAHGAGDDDKNALLKKTLLQQLGILKTFAEAPTAQNQEALRKISRIGSHSADIDALVSWESLYDTIDHLYDGFHRRVTDLYPGTFSDKEMQILMLIKAGFSTKEIGVLTRQSSATIYVRKTSIRKKLGAAENSDFIAFLDDRLGDKNGH